MSVTTEQFVAAFRIAANRHRMGDAVVENWRWLDKESKQRDERHVPPSGQVTTEDLTRVSQRVLFEVADLLGLDVTWECPPTGDSSKRLDAVLFQSSTRRIEVAWEHESLRECCDDEIGRLRSYQAPLSVLVTYLCPYKTKTDSALEWLHKYKSWFEQAPVDDRAFLVIFATVAGGWEFYQYRPDGFQRLL